MILLMFTSNLTNAQCTSFNGATGTDNVGSQAFTGRLGMRFTVNSPIIVSQLGAFDSGQDGFNSTIFVGIVNSAGTVVVPSSGNPLSLVGVIGTYVGPYQMVGGFPPVTLAPGTYTIVTYGYGPSEMNGNSNAGDALSIANAGGGLITHVDSPWDFTAAMGVPTNTDIVGRFHAGNFTFESVPPNILWTANTLDPTFVYPNGDKTATVCQGLVGRYVVRDNQLGNLAPYTYQWNVTGGVQNTDWV
ncbi:MAG: hypothetical protein MUE72_09150, partial [Chitinophagaceae bacterium]|nr:hypothetical protein [Chitinophagaceae bacterium]